MNTDFLAEIRRKIEEEKENKAAKGGHTSFGEWLPFWKQDFGQENSSIVRVLPHAGMKEGDIDPFIYKYEHVISINGEDKKIVCGKTYGERCPICDLSQKYYKNKDEEKGKYYWRSRQAIGLGYVLKDGSPLTNNEEPREGTTKVLSFGNQLSERFSSRWKTLFSAGKMKNVPWDLVDGYNFTIVKTKRGQYANYEVDSDFDFDPSSLPDEFIESYAPVDLTKYLPKRMDPDEIQRMLDAHMTGEEYEDEEDNSDDDSDELPEFVSARIPRGKQKVEETDSSSEKQHESEPEHKPKVIAKPAKKAPIVEESDEDDDEDDAAFLARMKNR